MQEDWGYHILRDMFAFKARKALKLTIFDGPEPGDEDDVRAAVAYRAEAGKRL
jgi:hypothetical protein